MHPFVWTHFDYNDEIQTTLAFFISSLFFIILMGFWSVAEALGLRSSCSSLHLGCDVDCNGSSRVDGWCTEAFALGCRFSQLTMLGCLPVVVSLALLLVQLG